MTNEERKIIKYLSKMFHKFWKKLLRADKPKKRDTKTNNFYFNLFFVGVVIFHISGSLITRLEAGGDLDPRYTGMLTVNLVGIYLGSMGLMKLYRRAKRTVAMLPESKTLRLEMRLIKGVRKARTFRLRKPFRGKD